jgi:hypothetical protein
MRARRLVPFSMRRAASGTGPRRRPGRQAGPVQHAGHAEAAALRAARNATPQEMIRLAAGGYGRLQSQGSRFLLNVSAPNTAGAAVGASGPAQAAASRRFAAQRRRRRRWGRESACGVWGSSRGAAAAAARTAGRTRHLDAGGDRLVWRRRCRGAGACCRFALTGAGSNALTVLGVAAGFRPQRVAARWRLQRARPGRPAAAAQAAARRDSPARRTPQAQACCGRRPRAPRRARR